MNRRLRGKICLQEKPAAGRENLQTSKCILSVVVGVSNPPHRGDAFAFKSLELRVNNNKTF